MQAETPPKLAQGCLAFIATDDEREDRLGDLEEAFHRDAESRGLGAARRRYTKDAALCCLSILRRRLAYAVLFGGEDMFRILLWAIISIFVILTCYALAGGQTPELVQPVEWAIILLTMTGCALGANRLRGWGQIFRDLRRAERLGGAGRAAARTAAINHLFATTAVSGAAGPVKFHDFTHLEAIVELVNVPGADADCLIGGSIALYRDRSEHTLKIIRATMIDAYVGAGIAFTLGLVHAFRSFQEPLEVMYALFGASCCPLLFGLLIAHGVVAPMGGRLSDLYGEDFREMEALRLSMKFEGGKATINAIEIHMPQIMDAIQLTLRDKVPDDFRGSVGIAQLRLVLQAQINALIAPQEVSDVLFKQLLVGQPEK